MTAAGQAAPACEVEAEPAPSGEAAGSFPPPAKVRLGLAWSQLAEAVGRPVAWTTSALVGQQPMTADQAKTAGSLLELEEDVLVVLDGKFLPYQW